MLPTVCDVSKKITAETGPGTRRSLEIIVNCIMAYTPIDEIVYVRYNSKPENPIWGQFRKFVQQPSVYQGEKTFVEIRYASHLPQDYYRFIVSKELCHALDADEGSHSITNRSVTKLINTFSLWSANKRGGASSSIDAEIYAEIGALELLCPIEHRQEIATDETSTQVELCKKFGIPQEYAEWAFSRSYTETMRAMSTGQ